jgi:hypothetical protein
MSICNPMRILALVCCASLPLLPQAAGAQEAPMYTSCDYRFAILAAGQPRIRDFTYTAKSGASVPAREFAFGAGPGRMAVTVAVFPASAPVVDEAEVEHAAVALRQRGEVRFQATAPYDPGMPGRQINVFENNGRQLRASVYMADRRLTVTEASATPGDFPALQFEQSITLIDAMGNDLDRPNGTQEPRNFGCRR